MRMKKYFAIMALVLFAALPKAAESKACTAWEDSFDKGKLDLTRWEISHEEAPGHIAGRHMGFHLPGHVNLRNGLLSLVLVQSAGTVDNNQTGIISYGAMIETTFECGYGTYEWRMRMSSTANCPSCPGKPISGSVSAGFIFADNSKTEIDFEFSGMDPGFVRVTNWQNKKPKRDPTSKQEKTAAIPLSGPTDAFHDYKFVWVRKKISYYIDGRLVAEETKKVPSTPATLMINHWGTDDPTFGGTATVGITRYAYITKVRYTPPE